MDTKKKKDVSMSRRDFLAASAAAAAAFTAAPSHALGRGRRTSPNSRIAVGIIGVGGQGINDMRRLLEFEEVQVAAVSDPMKVWDYSEWWYGGFAGREPAREIADAFYAETKRIKKYKGCAAYADFREMLEKQDLDAVLVATPDNLHAAASMAAIRKCLHVYCEKPLTHSVAESRIMAQAAAERKLATQMGNAGQASEEARRVAECIADGAIGAVTEVHDWTDRPIWPQGMGRPLETPPVPDVLDWDLWLGPAPVRPYHPAYVSVRWRGWIDFGTGALGDIGCHDCHPIFKALHLGHPLSVEASWSQPVGSDLKKIGVDESFPVASVVRYEFPARDGMPPVVLHWYDGGIKPSRPEELESGREWRSEGTLYVGDRGKMLDGRIIPETRMQEYTPPPKTLPRSPGHFEEWIRAIQGGEPAGANFDFASMVTEVVLLGNIAIRTGKKLLWDGPNMKITNDEAANAYLQRTYREGWTL